MKKIKLFILLLSISWCSFSQEVINGVVTDNSGMPIPGINILEKGKANGAVTDFDGGYKITVDPNAVLVFSSIGFQTQEIKTTGKTTINVTMKEDIQSLSEIVVVGYGAQKKESVLGSISQIKGEELLDSGSSNVTNALSGVSPGLVVVQGSGQPGADDGDIFIRGNANPLILVDGVEIVGGFANINPRDVENISTLKDGAATAVYGIRGANGVIIITTKRGKTGRPKVSYNSEFSVKSVLNEPDNVLDAFSAQSAFNTGILNDQAYTSGYASSVDLAHWRDGDLPYIYPNTDWFDVAIRDDYATSLNQTISVRGGSDFVKYYASAGYLTEGDITKTEKLFNYDPKFKFKRYTFRGNLDFTLTKTTRLNTSVSSRLEDKNQPGNGSDISFLGLYNSAPGGVVPVYPASVLEQYPDPFFPGLSEPRYGTGRNIYTGINASGTSQDNKTVFSIDLELEQDLDFITEGLKFTGKYNYISSYTTRSRIAYDATLDPRLDTYTLDRDGSWISAEGVEYERPLEFILGSETINDSQEISYQRAQLNYQRSFGKHSVTGLALASRNKRVSNTTFPFYNEDYVGRATYNYDSRYFFELSGSYNGDETFAEGYRFKLFPSYAVGINLAKENFIKDNIPEINNFKIRYSYGETGSKAGLGSNRWQYLSFYDFYGEPGAANTEKRPNSRYYFGLDIDDPLLIVTESQIGNPVLTWATVAKQNIGVEFGFFNNKISGEVDFFKDSRTDLISIPGAIYPAFYGFSADLPFVNLGASESHGYEISLTYKNKTSGGFKYSATAFYGFNENRILKSALDGPGTTPYTSISGKPAGASALLQTDGYFQNIDEVVNYPTVSGTPGLGDYRYIDYNANGAITGTALDDQVRFDLPNAPKNSYSLKLSGSYKGWSLSALINGVEGHRGLVNSDLAFALPDGLATGLDEHLDYWTPTNTNAAYPALHAVTNPNLINDSTARIVDLDYIKLRSVNLGYNFDMSNSKTLSDLRVYLNGNNLLVISDLDYGDPEANNPGSYPVLRRINLGINMTF